MDYEEFVRRFNERAERRMREFDAAAAALSEAMEKIEQKPPETESEPPPARPRRRGRVKGILA